MVVSTGIVLSMFTSWLLMSLRLPAASTTDVSNVCLPVPLTATWSSAVHGSVGALGVGRHSPCRGEPPSDLGVIETVTGPARNALEVVVVLVGFVLSMPKVSSTHGVYVPALKARC